jgi:hypothetical protein
MIIINCCDTTKNKKLWICEYFQKLNAIIKNDPYRLPFIDKVHHCCKIYLFWILANLYYMEDWYKVTFITN